MGYLEDAFISILNMSITASYVAAAVIIARLLLKKAPKVFSYALWSVVLFRLVCPFSFSFAFSLLGLIQPVQTGMFSTQYIPQNIGTMKTPTVDTGIDSVNAAFNASLPAASPYESVNPMQILITLGTLIWSIGVAVLLIYAVISYLRLKKQINMATLISDNVYETDLIRSPFVCGLVKPKIYLPLCLAAHEREYILCHEQTHIRRLDYLVKPVAFLALALHWFNPLMWLCFSLMAKDMEMSCDESVIQKTGNKEAASYSNSLLALATNKRIPCPSPLAFGESNVKARIKNLLHYKKPAFSVTIAAVVTVIIAVVVLVSNPISGFSRDEHPETIFEYDVDFLMKNKTPYIGNHIKVGSLINGMPLPEGITRGTLELSTSKPPYGVTYNYTLKDDSIVISEEQFLRNSVLLFALIDNADEVTHIGYWNNKLLSSTPFKFTYTRDDAEKIVGGDVRQFAESPERLTELIEVVQLLGADKTKAPMKGLELYVWRKPELTGNDDIYYTLLQGTNRNKTEDEIYNLSIATTNSEDIKHQIASYGEVDVFVSHPLYIPKEEMDEITDRIKTENGKISVGTGWFENTAPDTYGIIGGADGPTQIILSSDKSLPVVEQLLQKIMSSPQTSSNPGDYIEEHKDFYKGIVTMDTDALRYMFSEFSKGGQTGLRGHIMERACREILGDEDIKTAAAAQEWYDSLKAHVKTLVEKNSVGFVKENYPKAAMVLD